MNLKDLVAIKIIRPGILSTIQDPGRIGFRALGIGPGGAMDFFAAAVANFLVDNNEREAILEMHFPAAQILFEEDALISITGGNFSASINDRPIVLWKPVFVEKGQLLSFKKYINGARTYIAFHGGIETRNWLGSFSTHVKIRAGGHLGRPLLKEDSISINKLVHRPFVEDFADLDVVVSSVYHPATTICCIRGPEWQRINDQSKTCFQNQQFLITGQSDRMGYRLRGTGMTVTEPYELVSSPVDHGTIQLLPDGQLIILMADHQTAGGYARIANVITADLPKLSQLPAHSHIQFNLTTIENAEEELTSIHQLTDVVRTTCKHHYDTHRHQL